MSDPEKSCESCKFLEVSPDKNGKIRVKQQTTYRCIWVYKAPELPICITGSHGYVATFSRRYVLGRDGTECPTYERRIADV